VLAQYGDDLLNRSDSVVAGAFESGDDPDNGSSHPDCGHPSGDWYVPDYMSAIESDYIAPSFFPNFWSWHPYIDVEAGYGGASPDSMTSDLNSYINSNYDIEGWAAPRFWLTEAGVYLHGSDGPELVGSPIGQANAAGQRLGTDLAHRARRWHRRRRDRRSRFRCRRRVSSFQGQSGSGRGIAPVAARDQPAHRQPRPGQASELGGVDRRGRAAAPGPLDALDSGPQDESQFMASGRFDVTLTELGTAPAPDVPEPSDISAARSLILSRNGPAVMRSWAQRQEPSRRCVLPRSRAQRSGCRRRRHRTKAARTWGESTPE
jgi:hypothetical protein